eukprot:XP_017946416.1 PREDICTED: GRB2-associated-binding protein 1 [Xenopus tropicalis]
MMSSGSGGGVGAGGGGEVVCSGWLRKSPPEKKLKRFAWKRRWFVLRSGRLTGDPDVLEYYKNDHAKKPIRIIDLNLCEQVDAGLVFNKKEFENSYIFDIKTIDRVFYLVAESEEEMNKWVRNICDICGFNPTDEGKIFFFKVRTALNACTPISAYVLSSLIALLCWWDLVRKSTAMGSALAPSYANLYMAQFESSHLLPLLHTSILAYFRYIDDLFLIWTKDEESLLAFHEYLNNLDCPIKLTINYDRDNIDFLDLNIFKDQQILGTRLFRKPTDRNSILHASSHHPPTTIRGIPYSQFLRVIRNNSSVDTAKIQLQEMFDRFLDRGYTEKLLITQLERALQHSQDTLLNKTQKHNKTQSPLIFTTTFSSTSQALSNSIHRNWPMVNQDESLSLYQAHKPLMGYKRGDSLRDLLEYIVRFPIIKHKGISAVCQKENPTRHGNTRNGLPCAGNGTQCIGFQNQKNPTDLLCQKFHVHNLCYCNLYLQIRQGASSLISEDDYLLLEDFESKKISWQTQGDSTRTATAETDCNDNVATHKGSSAQKHAVNGYFQQSSIYDSPSRGGSSSTEPSFYSLPRSYSQDVSPKATSPSAADMDGDSNVFNMSGASSLETQLRQFSLSYDIPPSSGSTYQIPRTVHEGALGQSSAKLESITDVPPPRPPKPHQSSERSPSEYGLTRTVSETDSNYCVPTSGMPASRSNTVSTLELSKYKKDTSSQDFYDIPRPFTSDRSSSLEGFHGHFKNKSLLGLGSFSNEELDENYVPMNPNSPPRQHSNSCTEPVQETNYVPMTPGMFDFSSFGMQVPPPAHMGFRSSPKTPPRRSVPSADCEPPPVDRNLKPDRKGQSPKILRPKPHGLERTDSQTIGEFSTRRKVRPAPLEIKPLPEWEELMQTPVRSPVTRSFTRDSSRFPMPPRPDSVHSTASSSDSQDSEENYVAMNPSLSTEDPGLFGSSSLDEGHSPMIKPKGDKQVEYLDLDLDSGKSTPPRKKKSVGSGSSAADEKVDYVVVDKQKTLALKSTREAWTDGRQSTETETPTKNIK